jgi:hypothetical protein
MESKYKIESKSGVVLGVYSGETKEEAYLALCRDAGYDSAVAASDFGSIDDLIFSDLVK